MNQSQQRENRRPNRLVNETSPYLLQHAYNPVDWHPWDEKALAKSRDEEKPIFLSIGYSACHWCHVMEHESFENESIAALMNEHFVCIKVDREERPDLDQIYMNSVQLLTGRGGWPMSVFLTSDLRPFYGGTYWPPESRMGMPGFREILMKIHDAWETQRDAVMTSAEELTRAVIQSTVSHSDQTTLDESLLEHAQRSLLRSADRNHGGFGGAPKFPHPMDVRLLLRTWKRFDNDEALDVVRLTLDKMSDGGIYDHLGGGFHRYSTDGHWLAPHFEKMLYDNALLTSAYLEAFQATANEDYTRVVRETLDYVLREMTQPEGGFYSTQDADSEGVEGKFFVWTEDEVNDILGDDDARLFKNCYDVTATGNWEAVNILNRSKTDEQTAEMLQMDENELAVVLHRCRQKLFETRSKRVHPGRDEKVIVSWNGLMIAAMAQATQILGEEKYAQAACNATDFILDNMRDNTGRLLHSYKDGRARFNAYLDDYACLIDGLVELYQATFAVQYLETALELAEQMIERYHDTQGSGFFYTSIDHEELITRNKDTQDTATPSGNGVAATALLKLGRLCGRTDLEEFAIGTLEMTSGQMSQYAMASGQSLIALDFLLGPTYEIAIVDGNQSDETQEVLQVLNHQFLPNKVVARRSHAETDETLSPSLEPLLAGRKSKDAAPTIYLCEHGSCHEPVVGISGLRKAIEKS